MRRSDKRLLTYIYVLHDGDGHCKIGRANDPLNRLASMNSGNHRQISLLHWFMVPRALAPGLEKEAHRRLGHRQARGEWFHCTPAAALEACVAAAGPHNVDAGVACRSIEAEAAALSKAFQSLPLLIVVLAREVAAPVEELISRHRDLHQRQALLARSSAPLHLQTEEAAQAAQAFLSALKSATGALASMLRPRLAQRDRALELHASGLSGCEIAKLLRLGTTTVNRWISATVGRRNTNGKKIVHNASFFAANLTEAEDDRT